MDLYCPKCGESWELDSIGHENDRPNLTPTQAFRAFRERGCSAVFDGVRCNRPAAESPGAFRALVSAELGELLGDDVDGLASLLEDFGI